MRLLLVLLLLLPVAADPARDWCSAVEREVAETGEYGPLWVNELKVNAQRCPWPAVGRYERTFRFYYARQEAYPDRLRCVAVEAATSERTYAESLIYDDEGRLVRYRSGDLELLFWQGQPVSGPETERQRVLHWAAALRRQFLAGLRLGQFP